MSAFHQQESGAIDLKDLTAELIACAVFNHHGLIDLINETGESGFDRRKSKQPEYDIRALNAFFSECADRNAIETLFSQASDEIQNVIDQIPEEAGYDEVSFYLGFLARLITSTVVSGDREDTAAFMSGKPLPQLPENMKAIWESSIASLEKKLESMPKEGKLQKARKAFSDQCYISAKNSPGIYRLDLPTGGGKTLGALRYAIEHARQYNKKRVFYVAPLLSILEQNADVIRDAIGNDNWILEHHSNIASENKDDDQLQIAELLQESWNVPVVITTMLRFLETLFSGRMSDVRRMHALCDSVIIIDEVQSLPPRMLSMFNCAMNFLYLCCNTTIVLCSATQPPFHQIDHQMLCSRKKIVDQKILQQYASLFKRTEICFDGSYRTEEIPKYLHDLRLGTNSLLAICNTKNEASTLFHAIQSEPVRLFHLSAGMCMAHRKKVLEELQKALTQREPLICISTQVIEAGIDISFEAVVRFSAGLESIVQSAGRCNRHGESDQLKPVRIIQHSDQKLGNLEEIVSAQKAWNDLVTQFGISPAQFDDDLASDPAVEYYYNSLYRAMPRDAMDYPVSHNTLFSMLASNDHFLALRNDQEKYGLNQAFKTAAELFSVFENDSQSILIPYGQGKEIIQKLKSIRAEYDISYAKEVLKTAKGYDVSIPSSQLDQLQKLGVAHTVCNDSVYVADLICYDEMTGMLSVKEIKERLECSTLIL